MSKEDKNDAKTRLLKAGLKLFAEKGYEGSTFRDICEEAGSNIASINYYYKDKESFYAAVRQFSMEQYRERIQECFEQAKIDPWLGLKAHITLLLDKTYDQDMHLVNWLHLREILDMGNAPKFAPTPEMEAGRHLHDEKIMALLSALLEDSASPENIKLLHFTYYSLCQFLPIHKQIEENCLKGQGAFSILQTDKQKLIDFIYDVVKRTVISMKDKSNDRSNGNQGS